MADASKFQAVLEGHCPGCRQGKIFKYPFYSLSRFDKMNDHCPHCGLRFEIEPGYFIGAMYISYAFSGGIALILGFLLYHVAGDPGAWTYVGVICPAILLAAPINFRLSRILWLHYVSGIPYKKGQV